MPDQPSQLSRPWRVWAWIEGSTVGLPVALAVLDVVGTLGAANNKWHNHTPDHPARPLDWIAWVLLLIGPAALHHRRRFPLQVLAIVLGATLGYLLLGYPVGPIYLNSLVAVVGVAGAGYRRAAWVGSVLFASGLLVSPVRTGVGSGLNTAAVLSVASWLLAVILVPEIVRVRRERVVEAARIHDEEARRQASDERLAIARELHDVLAHSISLIAVQANVALEVMDRKPEQARIALVAIKEASRSALGEVRSVLDALRGTEAAPRDPAPGLDRLGDLVRQTEAAGLQTRLVVQGELDGLPVAVGQAAYRIVQESLTNVVRHAAAGRVHLLVERGADLQIRVTDDGRGGDADPPPGNGNGIPGMRERAHALGGELTAGPMPGGGFRVDARLPLPERSQ